MKYAIFPDYNYYEIDEIPDYIGDDYMIVEGDPDDVEEDGTPKCIVEAWINRIQDPIEVPFNRP